MSLSYALAHINSHHRILPKAYYNYVNSEQKQRIRMGVRHIMS
jgi:hypothetical protein